MTKKYEVQEFCLCGGWTNTWTFENGKPSYFLTHKDAVIALDWFLDDCEEEVEAGNMEDCPDKEDFRIVEIKNV